MIMLINNNSKFMLHNGIVERSCIVRACMNMYNDNYVYHMYLLSQ